MSERSLLDAAALPRPFDEARAKRGVDDWRAAGDDARRIAADPRGAALLDAVFGNSPFLGHALLADPAYGVLLIEQGPEAALDNSRGRLEVAALGVDRLEPRPRAREGRVELGAALRRAKRETSLAVALADIAGHWSLDAVTGALAGFADLALSYGAQHLLGIAHDEGELALRDRASPEQGSGFAVIGMGKYGAAELNYSSDIDLMVFYDQEVVRYTGKKSPQDLFVRVTRDLTRLMTERTGEGYVFRVDLRLRPDPGISPVAMSMGAAEAYYESMGQNWERAAMIKARAAAGDRAAGGLMLQRLAPFVWRRHLDFAAIADIHSIKRQINAHHGHGEIAVAGHDIKLGHGGIREIEFFAQTQQLIAGGRDRRLREPRTVAALEALAASGRISGAVAQELTESYEFHRRVEHRLQMIDDQQTHSLPTDPDALVHVATFLGFADADAFAATLRQHLRRVRAHYAALFEKAPSLGAAEVRGSLVFTGTEDDPATLATLGKLGFRAPSDIAARIRGWHHGRVRAMRSTRARELLTELTPTLLQALTRAADPDAAFRRFDAFLTGLPAGVQLFSLLHANPYLLDLLTEIMSTAPRLAERLSHRPALLDALLAPDLLEPSADGARSADALVDAVTGARHFEDALDATRQLADELRLILGVRLLRGRLDAATAGRAYATLAEVVIAALYPTVSTEFERAHGPPPGGGMAVLALGKLGSREMNEQSDLDLIFVYEAPANDAPSTGARPLPPTTYYARLSQRLLAALTAQTAAGQLYQVDMRLRPSGTSGPVAVDLVGFRRYQTTDAWTWEHMAMTRARTIAGPPALTEKVEAVVADVLNAPRDPAKLRADVADMRRRIAREFPGKGRWDIKYVRGGLVDLEFIVQYLALAHPDDVRVMLRDNTATAIAALAVARRLSMAQAQALTDAWRLYTLVQAVLRLSIEGAFDPAQAPPGLVAALGLAAGKRDLRAVERALAAAQKKVASIYDALLETAPVQPVSSKRATREVKT
jgi:[glutamine synthetase] adenylyltransferase / [glutamine synthetase]-adenylyl-L-tyrosine phosphorylase